MGISIAVIGAGIRGTSIAAALAASGACKVTLLESGEMGGAT
jgi:glycine/D-amino acid oxidase-like deaminating enzyme